MTATTASPHHDHGVELAAIIGLVCKDLDQYRSIIHALASDERVQSVEFSAGAPLFKGSPQIVAALKDAEGLRGKIDAYFDHALVDDVTRVAFARRFADAWIARHRRSERQDLFRASGDVFVFAFELMQPVSQVACDAIAGGRHDATLLSRLRAGDGVNKEHLRVTLRLFLDHPLNPRRHLDDDVARAGRALDVPRPYVIEATTSLALPGYAKLVLGERAGDVGAAAAWLG